MTDKAVISEYTYRSLASQREASGDMPVFILPDDLSQLFRQTTRKTDDLLHVESLGVLAETEEKFRVFLDLAKKRKAQIVSREDNQTFPVNGNIENLVKWFKDARRKGSAVEGGRKGGATRFARKSRALTPTFTASVSGRRTKNMAIPARSAARRPTRRQTTSPSPSATLSARRSPKSIRRRS